MKKCFLFHAKSFFLSWDIYIFVLTFPCVEKRVDKKTKVDFKIYDVTVWTTDNAIHRLPNISRSKVNNTVKSG